MSPARGPSEAEIIFNKANVALARSQRLIASWLPPRTAEEVANAKSEEDLEREDREMFAPVPELYARALLLHIEAVNAYSSNG